MLILPLVLGLFFMSVCARISNVTIDDTLGDEVTGQIPQYAPDGWIARSVSGAPCDLCTAQPDATRIYKGTWHDRSTLALDQIPSTISMSFNGTRIYVYFILFNNIDTVNHNTRLRFYLDGSSYPAQDFLHLGDPASEKYLYSQLVYDSLTLEPANHTLVVSSYSNGTDGSLALFDRAVYTTGTDDVSATQIASTGAPAVPVPAPQSADGNRSHAPRIGVVIGSAVAGALVLALAIGCWLCFRRRRPCALRRRGGALVAPLLAPDLQPQGVPTAAVRSSKATSPVSVFDDSAQLRSELEQLREELKRVRRIAEPPDYTQVSVSS